MVKSFVQKLVQPIYQNNLFLLKILTIINSFNLIMKNDENIKSMKLYNDVDRVYNELKEIGKNDSDSLQVNELTSFDQLHYHGTDALDYAIKKIGINSNMLILEIGSGIGEHLKYEKLTKNQKKNYFAMDSRTNVLKQLKKEHPNVKTILGDCQKKIKFNSNYFDRIIAIHVLEHLPNLPATIKEVYRLLKNKGEFLIVIPCEGSLAYSLARKISAERLFKKKYNMSYDWFIKTEHINLPKEIISVIEEKFTIKKTSFFPMYLPLLFCNLCIGMIFKKK